MTDEVLEQEQEGKIMGSLNEVTISKLSKMINQNEISVKEMVQEYLTEIKRFDQGENGLNSIIEINPEAMEQADKLDDQHTKRKSKLFGIPILIKDNISTADQMHTSAGSMALADLKASKDAEIVKALKANGAFIMGKTNMTEFANFMSKEMPQGYSSRGGQVVSPYDREKSPGGSSSGSAVAVTANLCTAAMGTDTSGSIVSPANNNSIVGFRPSMGSLSHKGILPISFTCDTAGPMTRTVEDAAIMYSQMTGITIWPEASSEEQQPMTIAINEYELKNLSDEEANKAETIIKLLEKAGMTIKKVNIEPTPKEHLKSIQRYEFKYAINRYLSNMPKDYPIRSLKDIIEYNKQNSDQALQYGQTLLVDAQENTRGDLSEDEYIELLKDRERKKMQVLETVRGMDACLFFQDNLTLQYTGLPVITIPHGVKNDGMPYGVNMTALTDAGLLKAALIAEQSIGYRVTPSLQRK